ncbi:MAG: hypothetical protein IJ113_03205 [Eggerthellaceae bacterium]|nr:hypothetical protein [Eggerthellaceae bacterium]
MAEDKEKKQEELSEEAAGNTDAPEAKIVEDASVEATEVVDGAVADVAESEFPQVAAESLKAKSDLENARASVSKVAVAQEQLKELMGAWLDGEPVDAAGQPAAQSVAQPVAQAAVQPVGQTAEQPMGQPVAQAAGQAPSQIAGQSGVQPAGQAVTQPGAQPMTQAVYEQTSHYPAQAPTAPAQSGYWQGFQPVQPTQPAPAFAQQAQPVAPMQTPYAQQPYAQAAGTQPYAQQPYQQTYRAGVQPQGQVQGQVQQPVQAQAPAAQVQAQAQPHVQAQAQVQPQVQAQPAGYSQAYTPQIQQPAGYVPAQDFTVQPQPQTPEYTKSNKATVGIVLVLIVGVLAIIASLVIGRILATNATDYDSPLIESLNVFEDGQGNDGENGQGNDGPYSDHNPGGSGGSGSGPDSGSGPESGSGDSNSAPFAFNWDDDGEIDWDDPAWDEYHGAQHVTGGGIDADDGELHSAWDKSVAYTVSEADYSREGTEKMDFYNKTIAYDFEVEYPQLKGDIKDLDKINKAIEETAMRFVDTTYTNPTSEARSLLETYASGGFGVPKDADAILETDVDYAITFNNNDFVSIAFSDEHSIGSWTGGFIALYTLNVNLKTGDVYELNDVLKINDEIAGHFIDNLSKYDGGAAESVAGRDSLIGAIQGKGSNAKDVTSTFFIDGNGKVNLGVSYRLDGSQASARGWWDYTLTDAELEAAKKDSPMWDLIQSGAKE